MSPKKGRSRRVPSEAAHARIRGIRSSPARVRGRADSGRSENVSGSRNRGNTNAAAVTIGEKAAEMTARNSDVRLAKFAAEPVD